MGNKIVIKIVTSGEGGTGKTTLLHRYVNKAFNAELKMTIGVEFFVKSLTLEDQEYALQLWDFGGQERFRFMLESYLIGAKGAILMVDLTRMHTLGTVGEWVKLLRSKDANLPILLIGSKLDLTDKISVEESDLIPLVEKYQLCGILKVSSKTGENVEQVFIDIVKEIMHNK